MPKMRQELEGLRGMDIRPEETWSTISKKKASSTVHKISDQENIRSTSGPNKDLLQE